MRACKNAAKRRIEYRRAQRLKNLPKTRNNPTQPHAAAQQPHRQQPPKPTPKKPKPATKHQRQRPQPETPKSCKFTKNFSKKVRKHIHQVRKRNPNCVDDIPTPGKGGVEAIKNIIKKRVAQGGGRWSTYAGEPALFYKDGGVVYVLKENGAFWTILKNKE